MNAAPEVATERMITEPLTWAQICEKYPEQWVCVVEIVWDEPKKWIFSHARVVGYGPKRKDPIAQAKLWRDTHRSIGHFYTGTIKVPSPRFFL